MRALTTYQPYAELIASGVKRVENRTWETKYRGRLYIHAGRSREWLSTTTIDGVEFERYTGLQVERLAFGAVVAIALLVGWLIVFRSKRYAPASTTRSIPGSVSTNTRTGRGAGSSRQTS